MKATLQEMGCSTESYGTYDYTYYGTSMDCYNPDDGTYYMEDSGMCKVEETSDSYPLVTHCANPEWFVEALDW